MIEVQNVEFSYGREPFIEDLNLEFQPGLITAVIGPNGSGKSTLLKLASGLLTPARGKILYRGKDIKEMKHKEFAQVVSVLSQHVPAGDITVEDLVKTGRYPYCSFWQPGSGADKALLEEALLTTGCISLRHKKLNCLSGGERQRAFLAMALAQDTDVIFLDEPTTYLDIHVGHEIMELIRNLRDEKGKTVVMVLHDLNLAISYGDQIVLMEKGKVVKQGGSERIGGGPWIENVFQVRSQSFRRNHKTYYFFEPYG